MAVGRRLVARTGLFVVVTAMLAACATSGPRQSGDSGQARSPAGESAPPQGTRGSNEMVDVPDEILRRILEDAADRRGVGIGEVEVLLGRPETWNDGSLGCPEPGMFYTQALVDGYHVVVAAAGEELDYRVDRSGGFRICEDPPEDGLSTTPDE